MADPKIVLTAEDKTKAAFESVKTGLAGIQTRAVAVTGVLGALGVTAWAGGMARDVAQVTQEWDELGKAAQRTGFQSAQGMAEFQFAAKLAGVDAGGFEAAVGKLNAKMADAAGGSKEAAATFAAMGVKIKGANGELRASEDVLKDLAEKFASYKDGPEKSALAMDLFGKSGKELIPLLNGGAAGLEKLRDEFRKLRGQITDENVKAAEEFNDNLTKLEAATGSLARKLTGSLLDALVQVTAKMVEAAKEGGFLRGVLAGVIEAGKIATGTDELGSAKGRAQISDQRISHITTQMDVQQAILQRDPGNDAAGRRLEQLKRQLTEVQREALSATGALKDLVSPGWDKLQGATGDFARTDRAGSKPAAPIPEKPDTAAQSAYDAIIKRIKERLAGQTAELELGRALTDQEKFQIKVEQDLAAAKLKLNAADQKSLALSAEKDTRLRRVANERTADKEWAAHLGQMQDELNAGNVAMDKDRERNSAQITGETRALEQNAEMLALEARMLGATDRERAAAIENLRIELDLRNRLKELAATPMRPEDRTREEGRLRDNAEEAKRQATKRAGIDESREFVDQLRGDVRGALTRAFEDSKNPGKAFVDGLASTMYTRVSSALADALLGAAGLGSGATGNYLNGLLSKLSGAGAGGGGSPAGFLNEVGGMEILGSLGFHRGGVVGKDAPTFQRSVPAAVFRNAPRYHRGGIAGNEVPAILERGEEVLTANDPRHRRNGGGAGISITVSPTISIDSRSDRGAVASDVQRALAENNKAMFEQLRRNGVLA
jgi:hypothetical protein